MGKREDLDEELASLLNPTLPVGRIQLTRAEAIEFIRQTWGEEALADWPGLDTRTVRVPNTGRGDDPE